MARMEIWAIYKNIANNIWISIDNATWTGKVMVREVKIHMNGGCKRVKCLAKECVFAL